MTTNPQPRPARPRLLTLAGTSGLYLGIAAGGALGGAALAGYGGTGVVITASAIGLIALALIAASVARYTANRPAVEGNCREDVSHDHQCADTVTMWGDPGDPHR